MSHLHGSHLFLHHVLIHTAGCLLSELIESEPDRRSYSEPDRRSYDYKVGDKVMSSTKLLRFVGSFTIVEKVSDSTVQIAASEEHGVHHFEASTSAAGDDSIAQTQS